VLGTSRSVLKADQFDVRQPNPIALLFFDGLGHFAAQFMNRERDEKPNVNISGPISNNSRARDGYDAYFGTYQVDESASDVSTKLSAVLSPENVGQTFVRKMNVTGDELTIQLATSTISGEAVVRTLRWKRIG
jgi:hypothetical protein